MARYMLQYRGEGRNSMLTGSSTYNQRIERLWVDMRRSVRMMLFYFMEKQGFLDPLNEMHIFALHYTFVLRIDHGLLFQNGWNHHSIWRANHLSPYQLFVQGLLQLHASGLTAMDLFDNADEFYGTDDHGEEVIEDNTDIVTVPEGRFTLQGEQLVQLRAVIDPFQEKRIMGLIFNFWY